MPTIETNKYICDVNHFEITEYSYYNDNGVKQTIKDGCCVQINRIDSILIKNNMFDIPNLLNGTAYVFYGFIILQSISSPTTFVNVNSNWFISF